MKRKTYDVGSVELKFYVLAANVANLFYVAEEREHQLAAYDLIKFIYQKHEKYLDNVKHPAKKGRQSRELVELLAQRDQIPQADQEPPQAEMTNSNRLFQRINQLSNSRSKGPEKAQHHAEAGWNTMGGKRKHLEDCVPRHRTSTPRVRLQLLDDGSTDPPPKG